MRRFGLILAIGALDAAAACAPRPPQHDKAYYAAHVPKRAQEVAACQADPGGLGHTPNCQNATSAEADAHTAHFYDAPKPAARVQAPGQL